MDRNLKMGPKADKKLEKGDIQQTRTSKNGTQTRRTLPSHPL